MSAVEERLAGLGLALPAVPAPVAAYQPAVVDGERVWTSGQLPFVDGALPVTGKVGDGEGLVPPERAAQMARIAVLNALAAVKSVVGDLDRVVQVVKVVAFVAPPASPGSRRWRTAPASCSVPCSGTPAATPAAPSAWRACRWTRRSRSS